MHNSDKSDEGPVHFYRGEPLILTRHGHTQRVFFVEKMVNRTSKIVNKDGFLDVVFDFELSRIED